MRDSSWGLKGKLGGAVDRVTDGSRGYRPNGHT